MLIICSQHQGKTAGAHPLADSKPLVPGTWLGDEDAEVFTRCHLDPPTWAQYKDGGMALAVADITVRSCPPPHWSPGAPDPLHTAPGNQPLPSRSLEFCHTWFLGRAKEEIVYICWPFVFLRGVSVQVLCLFFHWIVFLC